MTPGRRQLFRRWAVLLGFGLLLLGLRWMPQRSIPPDDPQQLFTVDRVIDGDTLILRGGHRVRLFGVDTPELGHDGQPAEPGAEAAREFLQSEVEGREVSLGFDQELTDNYGRRLAYVYRRGTLINEEILRAGLSPAVTRFPYSPAMKVRFQRAEREAQAQHRGLWRESDSLPARDSTGAEVLEDE